MSAAPAITPAPQHLWAALGDSNTVGVGSDGPWSVHAARALGLQPLTFAGNGDRAADVLFRQVPQALAARPRLTGIFVGGNDVLRGDFDAGSVHGAIRTAVHRLEDAGSEVVVVLPAVSLAAHFPIPARVRAVMRDRLADLRSALVAAVVDSAAIVLDGEAVLAAAGRAALHVDRIHLSPLGQRLLARQAVQALGRRGFPALQPISPPPPPRPPGYSAAWLVVKGAPWLLRRSRDFLPDLTRIVRARSVQTSIATTISAPASATDTDNTRAVLGNA